MGVQRKRRRREERLEEEEQERAREPEEQPVQEQERERSPADRVLELQKTAGNRATTAALSRWGLPTLPLAAAPQWPKEPQVIVDGVTIPLDSFSWPGQASVGTGGISSRTSQYNDVNVLTTLGEHSAELARLATSGAPIKTVVIVIPGKDGKGHTITLENVLITGYSISDKQESWSLNFAKKEFSQQPPQAQPRG
jgi:hypothetical protein